MTLTKNWERYFENRWDLGRSRSQKPEKRDFDTTETNASWNDQVYPRARLLLLSMLFTITRTTKAVLLELTAQNSLVMETNNGYIAEDDKLEDGR